MYTIKNNMISVQIDRFGEQFTVKTAHSSFASNSDAHCYYTDKDGALHYFTEGMPPRVIVSNDTPSITFVYEHFSLIYTLNACLSLTLQPNDSDNSIQDICWPAPIKQAFSPDAYAVLPIMQGMLILDREGEAHNVFDGSYAGRDFTMPWWGQVSKSGSYMAFTDTPYDACCLYDHYMNESTTVRIKWLASLGKIGYTRQLYLRFFDDEVSYLDFCHLYREQLENDDAIVSLTQKAKANPNLNNMPGRPVLTPPMIHYKIEPESSYYNHQNPDKNTGTTTFNDVALALKNSKQRGIDKAYVHIDGWSLGGYDNLFPRVLPVNQQAGGTQGLAKVIKICHELDYLLVYHDQYRDFYFKSPDFNESQSVMHGDGSTHSMEETIWYGGYETQLCATQALSFVKRNYEGLTALGLKPDGAYLDVFSACILDECFHPDHSMTRKQCVKKRKECFDYIRQNDMIISSEELVGEFADSLDIVHHAPYIYNFFYDLHIQSFGICVPLINLVFHDSVIIPWGLGNNVWGLPKGESGLLHCLLNGGTPYIDTDDNESLLEDCKVACQLHESVAFEKMVSHSFIGDFTKQKSIFSNGIEVTVDFSEGSYSILWPNKICQSGKTNIS